MNVNYYFPSQNSDNPALHDSVYRGFYYTHLFGGLCPGYTHYGREAHSHERLVKKAGLGRMEYTLMETSIDTIFCYPLGSFVQCRYVLHFQDTATLNKRASTWPQRDDNGMPIKCLSHFDNFYGSQVAEITNAGELTIEADYPVESLSADYF